MGFDKISALVKLSEGGETLGSPSVEGLPGSIKPLASSVIDSSKGMKALEGVNPDETDLSIMKGLVQSPEFAKIFKKEKWYQLPWTPVQKAFKSVHPEFSDELTSWRNLLEMGKLKDDAEAGKLKFTPEDTEATIRWLEQNRPQRDLLYSAVTNRIEQLAKSGIVPSWSARRAIAVRKPEVAASK